MVGLLSFSQEIIYVFKGLHFSHHQALIAKESYWSVVLMAEKTGWQKTLIELCVVLDLGLSVF